MRTFWSSPYGSLAGLHACSWAERTIAMGIIGAIIQGMFTLTFMLLRFMFQLILLPLKAILRIR
jgi:hypothetical protein